MLPLQEDFDLGGESIAEKYDEGRRVKKFYSYLK